MAYDLMPSEQEGRGRRLAWVTASFLVVAGADALLPYWLSLTPLYLIVVLLACWSAGMTWGAVFLGASLFASSVNGLRIGHPFLSDELFYLDVASRFFVYLLVLFVAGTARAAYTREQKRARSDNLTGLANSAALYERIGIEIERQKRYGRPMALAYTDCDDFKRINDTRGHAAGDRLLRTVAQVLESNVRKTDLVARIGGDEFAILLPETGEREAQLVIGKLHDRLSELPEVSAGIIGFSIGVAVANAPPRSATWLIDEADHVMFDVKRAGKNAVRQQVLEQENWRSGAGKQGADSGAPRPAERPDRSAGRGRGVAGKAL